jgi:SP family sugar:H+ symporter-like MFS transporter
MTIPGILLIDRVGRRPLLLGGAAVMIVCEFIVAIVGESRLTPSIQLDVRTA